MIVAPEFQRQGIGSRLLDALLEEANRRSISSLGLVATAFGRPLYERSGFVPTGEVVVLSGRLARTDDPSPSASLDDEDVAPRAEERWIPCSREGMLRARFREAIATASVEGPRGSLLGYAMATSQEALTLIGPVMAETQEIARVVTSALSRSIPGPARIDVPAEQRGFRRWLEAHGFREQSVRTEMALGTQQLPWQVPERFALAAQAWG
jgi:hypothetical protein